MTLLLQSPLGERGVEWKDGKGEGREGGMDKWKEELSEDKSHSYEDMDIGPAALLYSDRLKDVQHLFWPSGHKFP